MNKMKLFTALVAVTLGLWLLPEQTSGQSFDALGTRAAGMGGAFVGVADDPSAVYWNPGGLAAGTYFGLQLDTGGRRAVPEGTRGQERSSLFLAASIPALGLSYYRLRNAAVTPDPLLLPIDEAFSNRNLTEPAHVRLDTLVTHHVGITLVQSIVPNVAVGSTLKVVRGIASSEIAGSASAEEVLQNGDQQGHGTTRFDVDLGVMATLQRFKAGLTLRNVREPEFQTRDGRAVRLERQARAGVSYTLTPNLLLAADADLVKFEDPFGRRRDAAVGFEGRLARRVTVRSGFRVNTAGAGANIAGDRGRAFTAGGSYAATASVWVDAVAVMGNDRAGRGWGIAARFVY